MDEERVAHLLEELRQRSSEELTVGVLALAGSLTPEMWRALTLLRMEQRGKVAEPVTESQSGTTRQTNNLPRVGH